MQFLNSHHHNQAIEQRMMYLQYEEIQESSSSKWRLYGEKHRQELLRDDRERGGSTFHINPSNKIDRYYRILCRVSLFFLLKESVDPLCFLSLPFYTSHSE